MLSENESVLKNITNKHLKTIFDLVNKTLIYINYKHFQQRNNKVLFKKNT